MLTLFQYGKWTKDNIHFVTLLKDNAVTRALKTWRLQSVVLMDISKTKNSASAMKTDQNRDKRWNYIFDISTQEIGGLYKMRWQIELLFKQLKQNFSLKIS